MAADTKQPPRRQPTDDEARIIAFIRWRATTTPNVDSSITLELLADELDAGKQHNDD